VHSATFLDWHKRGESYRECNADSQFVPLPYEREERRYGHKHRGTRPEKLEQDRVQASFDHPLNLHGASIRYTINPTILPGKELDEFDLQLGGGQSQLIKRAMTDIPPR
jgi:hypothetical protein